MRLTFGTPKKCEGCGLSEQPNGMNGNYFEWANVSGKYRRRRSDWKRLCIPCHKKFDAKSHNVPHDKGAIEKMREARRRWWKKRKTKVHT